MVMLSDFCLGFNPNEPDDVYLVLDRYTRECFYRGTYEECNDIIEAEEQRILKKYEEEEDNIYSHKHSFEQIIDKPVEEFPY